MSSLCCGRNLRKATTSIAIYMAVHASIVVFVMFGIVGFQVNDHIVGKQRGSESTWVDIVLEIFYAPQILTPLCGVSICGALGLVGAAFAALIGMQYGVLRHPKPTSVSKVVFFLVYIIVYNTAQMLLIAVMCGLGTMRDLLIAVLVLVVLVYVLHVYLILVVVSYVTSSSIREEPEEQFIDVEAAVRPSPFR